MSSISEASRAHNALVHCGAVRLVGSVRIRDLYATPVDGGAVSFANSSLDIRETSKADLILLSTAVDKSATRFCTKSGKTRKLWAVCSDEARSERFCMGWSKV